MGVRQGFLDEVEANLDQAVGEGWVRSRSTAATVVITIGCILAEIDAVSPPDGTASVVRETLHRIIGAVASM